MLKNISKLGFALNKSEQKSISGGKVFNGGKKRCSVNSDCPSGVCAHFETQTGSYPPGHWCL